MTSSLLPPPFSYGAGCSPGPQNVSTLHVLGFMTKNNHESGAFKQSKCLAARGHCPIQTQLMLFTNSLWWHVFVQAVCELNVRSISKISLCVRLVKGGQHVLKILHTLVWAWLSMSSTVEECWLQTFMLVCSCMFFSYSRTSSIVISERRSRRWQLPLLNANFQWRGGGALGEDGSLAEAKERFKKAGIH